MRSGSKQRSDLINYSTGSPDTGESVFILIGKIRKAHGVDGEIMVEVYSESTDRFKPGKTILVGEKHQPYQIKSRRNTSKGVLISLRDILTPEQVDPLRNQFIFTTSDQLPDLPEGEYYHFQLIGLNIEDETGKSFGKLSEIIETGANDVYVARDAEDNETLFPALETVIIQIDIKERKMIVRPQEWL